MKQYNIGNREIEFRAWDNKNKFMNESHSLRFMLSKLADHFFNGLIRDDINRRHDDLVWLEYTGLKDRNGKKIFEGDIIENYEGKRSLVVWNDSKSGWWIKRLNWFRNGQETWHILTFGSEVIGNVFRNPELLEHCSRGNEAKNGVCNNCK